MQYANTQLNHYVADAFAQTYNRQPSSYLTLDDYDPRLIRNTAPERMRDVCVGYTDWTTGRLVLDIGMVCSFTGYTRNQMLACMLNQQMRDVAALPSLSDLLDALL